MLAGVGPNLAAYVPGVRYWWNSGECLSVTCEMKRCRALSSRGCNTTAPVTVADGDTAPSCFAPRGIRGFGATTFVPVGAAAPAPAAEIVKHTSAKSGAATSAREPANHFMKILLIARLLPPPQCGPNRTPTYRTSETRCQLRCWLAMPEVVGAREGGVDVGTVGQRPGERRERDELADEDVPVAVRVLVAAVDE